MGRELLLYSPPMGIGALRYYLTARFAGLGLMVAMLGVALPGHGIQFQPPAPDYQWQGLLWRIEAPYQPVSYLFGTMHSNDPRVLALPKVVTQALNDCEALALEVLPNQNTKYHAGAAMLQPPGEQLSQQLGEPLFEQTYQALKPLGLSRSQAQQLKPWAIMILLSMPDETAQRAGPKLDEKLFEAARQTGKKTLGLERLAEQIDIFDQLDLLEQTYLVKQTLAQTQQRALFNEILIQTYLRADLQGLLDISYNFTQQQSHPLLPNLLNKLINERNQKMLIGILQNLTSQSTCVAVGALHLPGPLGLIELLRSVGYRVEALY